jgi:predicted nuclease with TOPRIM domain
LEESRSSPADETLLESRLESVRSEKDELEVKIAELHEQLARSQGEVNRLRETTSTLQEELKVIASMETNKRDTNFFIPFKGLSQ